MLLWKGRRVCAVCNKLQMWLMWQMQIWLAGMWYYHRSVSKQREGILVCVGVCFCPAHMKTFFPCQDCSRRLWNHTVTPLLTPRKHTTGKANTHTWSNSPTPPEDKGEWPCVCVCGGLCMTYVCVCGFVHWHGSLRERGSSVECKIEKSVQVRVLVHNHSVHTNRAWPDRRPWTHYCGLHSPQKNVLRCVR